jgi:hypothetical protein
MTLTNCLSCAHCRVEYEEDYSDVTPGAGLILACSKNKWYVSGHSDLKKDLKNATDMAETCSDYKEEKP